MASNCVCCLCGSYRCATAWAATLGLVQAIILLPLSILALLRQIWNVTELSARVPIPSLLYVYYFYNPNGANQTHTNGLALRTQILAYLYAVLTSLWLLSSIALYVKASRSRGSPWVHYTWGVVTLGIILADLIATSLYASDIFFITDFKTLSRETGFTIGKIENAPWYAFIAAPLIMMIICSKGAVLWIINIICTILVFIAGSRVSRKLPSRYSRRFVEDETSEGRDRQFADSEPPAAENVTRIPSAHLSRTATAAASPEHNQQIRTVNEELNARLQRMSSPRNFHEERTKQTSGSPRVVGRGPWIESPSRLSSRPVSPDRDSPSNTNPSSLSYIAPVPGPGPGHVRRSDSRRRPGQGVDDDESVGGRGSPSWAEPGRSPRMPVSPQSPLSRDPPETWWQPRPRPGDDEPEPQPQPLPQGRPAQPKPVPVSVSELRAELRAQLPWSYFQAPADLAVQPKSPSIKRSADRPPTIPAPDYTMHLQRGRHRSSTRELRELTPARAQAMSGLARSASDAGRASAAMHYRSQHGPNVNVHGAPFVITDATSRSPHFLRRPTEYTGY